jgi:hypothetical protein
MRDARGSLTAIIRRECRYRECVALAARKNRPQKSLNALSLDRAQSLPLPHPFGQLGSTTSTSYVINSARDLDAGRNRDPHMMRRSMAIDVYLLITIANICLHDRDQHLY